MTDDSKERFRQLAERSQELAAAAVALVAPMVEAANNAATDPRETMGLVQGLLRLAAMVAHSSLGTSSEVDGASGENLADSARMHWQHVAFLYERHVELMRVNGETVPEDAEQRLAKAPVDAGTRAELDKQYRSVCEDCAECAEVDSCELPMAQDHRANERAAKAPVEKRAQVSVDELLRAINTKSGGTA